MPVKICNVVEKLKTGRGKDLCTGISWKKLENWIYLHIYIYMQEANKLNKIRYKLTKNTMISEESNYTYFLKPK